MLSSTKKSDSASNVAKKASAKQKEREKKKLRKLIEKKEKQDKMKQILASLQSHKDDIKQDDYHKLQSAKLLGQNQRKNSSNNNSRANSRRQSMHEMNNEEEVEMEEEAVETVDQYNRLRPVIEEETRERVEKGYQDMEEVLR